MKVNENLSIEEQAFFNEVNELVDEQLKHLERKLNGKSIAFCQATLIAFQKNFSSRINELNSVYLSLLKVKTDSAINVEQRK